MRRLLMGVGVVVFSACQPAPPAPGLVLTVPMVVPAGLVTVEAEVENALGTTMTLRVRRGDEVLFERTSVLGVGADRVTLQPEVGSYVAELEVRRDGQLIASTSAEFQAAPWMPLSRAVRTSCSTFEPFDDQGTEFNCNGWVVDADGGFLSGHAYGDAQLVRTDAGVLRWVRSNGQLLVETPQGVSNAIAFPGHEEWLAGTELAVSTNALAMLQGQTLSAVDVDGREFILPPDAGVPLTAGIVPVVPLTAASRDGGHVIMFGPSFFDRMGRPTPHAVCSLEFNGRWRLTACPALNGVFVRREQDGRAVFQRGQELLWVDPMDLEHPQVIRTLSPQRQYALGEVLTRAPVFDDVFPMGEGWPPTLFPDGTVSEPEQIWIRANSEFAWGISQSRLNRTFWAPLP